jgi:hypothetical protein
MEEGPNIFISSCSRRQLARRRPAGLTVRGRRRVRRAPMALLLAAVLVGGSIGALVAMRGGL